MKGLACVLLHAVLTGFPCNAGAQVLETAYHAARKTFPHSFIGLALPDSRDARGKLMSLEAVDIYYSSSSFVNVCTLQSQQSHLF